MNPFQWLGIDPQIKNPNYFQLLGIKSLVVDETDFLRQVQQSVKAKLSLLDRPELAAHAEIVDKLKQRIMVAGGVLADPASRNQYLEQLKAAVQASAKSPQPSVQSGFEAGRSKKTPASKSLASTSSTSRDPVPASAQPAATSAGVDEIPFAIPMRKLDVPSGQAAPSPSPENSSIKIRFGKSNAMETSPESSPLGGAVLKTKVPARRKGSPLLTITGSLIAIAAMGGLVLMTLKLSQPRTMGIVDTDNPTEQAVPDNLASKPTDTELKNDELKPAIILDPDTEAEPEIKIDLQPEPESEPTPEEGESVDSDPESIDPGPLDPFEDNSPRVTETPPSINPDEDEIKPGPNEAMTDPELSKPNEEGEPKKITKLRSKDVWEVEPGREPITFTEAEQYLIDKHLRIILNRQRLRDDKAHEHTKALFEYLEKLYIQKNPEKSTPYERIVRSFMDTDRGLVGFWGQFEASVATVPAAQEIVVFERPMSFVEFVDDRLVMRVGGLNIRYRREHIPAELAIKIAEQGAIPDVPSWRLYLAAFLATQPAGHVRNKERITKLLEVSQEEGRDVSSLEDFLAYRADARALRLQAEKPDANSIAAVTRKVQERAHDFFALEMDELKPEESYDFWMKWEFLWFPYVEEWKDKPELKNEKPLIHTSLALLQNAISVATMTKEAAKLEEAAVEWGYLTSQNTDKILLEQLSKIAAQKLDLRQAIELKRVSEPIIARVEEDRELRPIAFRVQKRIQIFERQHKINGTGQAFGAMK